MSKRNGFTPVGLYQKIKLPWTKLDIPWARPETHGKIDIDKLEANFEALRTQLDDQSAYLNRVDWGPGVGTRWATIVLAAADSTDLSKQTADYVCNSSSAEVQIQHAINTLLSRTEPGRIVFLEGTYTCSAAISFTLAANTALCFQGMGSGTTDIATKIAFNSSSVCITANGPSGSNTAFLLRDIAITNSSSGATIQTNGTRVDADHCYVQCSSGWCFWLDGYVSGSLKGSRITNTRIAGGTRGITVSHEENLFFCDNDITVSGAGARGISLNGDAAYNINGVVTGNRVTGASSPDYGIFLNNSSGDGTYVETTLVANNYVSGFSAGIGLNGAKNSIISGNVLESNGAGLQTYSIGEGVGNQQVYVVGNYFLSSTGTAHARVVSSTGGTSDIAILFNKFRGTTPANSCVIGSSVNDAAFAFNDTFQGYSSAALSDSGANTRTESAIIGATITTNARVGVRKNSGAVGTFLRRRLNFIEGTDFSIGMSDDSVDEEVDVTLGLAATITSNARVGVRKNSTGSTYLRRRLNIIEGSGITITVADDSVDEEVDITINQAAGSGSGDVEGQFIVGFDGGGSSISTGKIQDVVAPFAGTIDSWEIFSDVADTVTVEIWKDVYANYPPTVADKITASAPPSLSAVDHDTSSTLTGWTTSVTAGDVLRFKITAVTVATRVLVVVHYTRP